MADITFLIITITKHDLKIGGGLIVILNRFSKYYLIKMSKQVP